MCVAKYVVATLILLAANVMLISLPKYLCIKVHPQTDCGEYSLCNRGRQREYGKLSSTKRDKEFKGKILQGG